MASRLQVWYAWLKGSIFAVSYSIESAKKFVENPRQKYKHTDLLILFEEDYFAIMIIDNSHNKKNSKIKCNLNYTPFKQEQWEKEVSRKCWNEITKSWLLAEIWGGT